MKHRLFIFLLVIIPLSLTAETMPENYYSSANGKADEALKTALHNIIKVGSRVSYGNATWNVFYYSDRKSISGTRVLIWDMYSDEERYMDNPNAGAPGGMNIEHSFAKSWWGGTENDAYKDCYHLNPSDATANSARSNYPLGEVTELLKTAGTLKIGYNNTYTGEKFRIWEPLDEYKGDFARAYFYMATCYENLTWRLDNTNVGSYYAMQADNYLEFMPWEQEVLLKWHRMDPVSQKEIDRMDAVSDFQHNRNPYIDYPCLVEYIWGSHQGEAVDFAQLKNTADADWLTSDDLSGCICEYTAPTLIRPVNGTVVSMGTANRNEQIQQTLTISGTLLTQDVQLTLTGADAECFSLSKSTVTAAQANGKTTVNLYYTPAGFGTHTATLTLKSSEVNTQITLQGVCEYNFKALPATDITKHSFTAHWTDAETDTYSLNLYTKVVIGEEAVVIINMPELSLSIIKATDNVAMSPENSKALDEDGGIRLGTGSANGTLLLSNLNIASEGKLTITAKAYGNDQSNLRITADGSQIADQMLTNTKEEYTFDIPEGTQEIALIQEGGKKRLYLYSIALECGGEIQTTEPVQGYPKEVSGTSADITVDTDLSLTPVYYTVTPAGNATSNEVEVRYNTGTSVEDIKRTADIYVEGRNITFLGLDQPTALHIYDALGRLITSTTVADRQTITIPADGFYLLQFNRQVIRVIIQ